MIDLTQDDVDDGPITPYREGFLDYMLGKFLWQNPYNSYGDIYDDDPDYYQWYDGWRDAQVKYPHLEPKEHE